MSCVIACILIALWLLIVFVISPLMTVIGIINGDVDIDTLQPKQHEYRNVQEQIRSESIIF